MSRTPGCRCRQEGRGERGGEERDTRAGTHTPSSAQDAQSRRAHARLSRSLAHTWCGYRHQQQWRRQRQLFFRRRRRPRAPPLRRRRRCCPPLSYRCCQRDWEKTSQRSFLEGSLAFLLVFALLSQRHESPGLYRGSGGGDDREQRHRTLAATKEARSTCRLHRHQREQLGDIMREPPRRDLTATPSARSRWRRRYDDGDCSRRTWRNMHALSAVKTPLLSHRRARTHAYAMSREPDTSCLVLSFRVCARLTVPLSLSTSSSSYPVAAPHFLPWSDVRDDAILSQLSSAQLSSARLGSAALFFSLFFTLSLSSSSWTPRLRRDYQLYVTVRNRLARFASNDSEYRTQRPLLYSPSWKLAFRLVPHFSEWNEHLSDRRSDWNGRGESRESADGVA